MADRPDPDVLLDAVRDAVMPWLSTLDDRPIRPELDAAQVLDRIPDRLPEAGSDPLEVVEELRTIAEDGLIAMGSPRFHGWVIGGALPAAQAADWMLTAWDQNSAMVEVTPVTVGLEWMAGRWLKELLDLPRDASVGFVTGGQMANFTCLAAGRQRVYDAVGVDLQAVGLQGAPPLTVIVGEARHSTIGTALRYLGIGEDQVRITAIDSQDRMLPDAVDEALEGVMGPVLVVAAAGSIHTGDVDPIGALAEVLDQRCADNRQRAWLHVDGAIGLWGRASQDPDLLSRLDGLERADSWSTDGHKWLNTPYDCGIAITADRVAHERAMNIHAEYIPDGEAAHDSIAYAPEMSRRGRGVTVWAALRQLGRSGVAELVDSLRARTREYAEQLGALPGCEVLHEVVLNQLTVRFADPAGLDDDAHTQWLVKAVQDEGTCFPTPSTWGGGAVMRISVSNHRTTSEDVRRSVAAIAALHATGRA